MTGLGGFGDIIALAQIPSILKKGDIQDKVLGNVGESINSSLQISISEAKAKEIQAWSESYEKVMGKKHTTMEELKNYKKSMSSF